MNRRVLLFLLMGMCLIGCSKQEAIITAQTYSTESENSNAEEVSDEGQNTDDSSFLYVYVCGYVERPGVYSLEAGSRICDALEMAGGVTQEGKPEALNQAEHLEDGQTIYVPALSEEQVSTNIDDGLVDINKADKTMLMTLPGIGESKADIIIQYRQEHGEFESIEELMDIPGIKEGVFNKIKDAIKVS